MSGRQMWREQIKKRDAGRIQWRQTKLGTWDLNGNCSSLAIWIFGPKLVAVCSLWKAESDWWRQATGGEPPSFVACPSLWMQRDQSPLSPDTMPSLPWTAVALQFTQLTSGNKPPPHKWLLVTAVVPAATLWFREGLCLGQCLSQLRSWGKGGLELNAGDPKDRLV